MPTADPLVVVGSGLAGWTLIREFRKLDGDSRIVLVTADSGDFYSKPMLSNALAQGKTAAQLVTTPAEPMAAQWKVTLLKGAKVGRIRPQGRRIELHGSEAEQPYAKLVLALGADPIRLPLTGDAAGEVLSVNDLNDYRIFRERLEGVETVAILGGGLIGCEFANDLAGAGYRVTVIDPSPYPLAGLLPEPAGKALLEPLGRLGITWVFGKAVQAVDRANSGCRLTLGDASTLPAERVLSAVGLRPRTALAAEAGLACKRGIVVDRTLQTRDPHIFALGDCAEIDGQVRPYVLPIMHAAKALAQTLAGQPAEVAFPPMPVVVKTPACPVAVLPVARDAAGAWQTEAGENGVRMRFLTPDGRLIGFALAGGRVAERMAMTRLLAS